MLTGEALLAYMMEQRAGWRAIYDDAPDDLGRVLMCRLFATHLGVTPEQFRVFLLRGVVITEQAKEA